MTLDELTALIGAGKVYRMTPDARYLIVVDEVVPLQDTDDLADALLRLHVPAIVMAVPDPLKLRLFKLDPATSPGELRPLGAKKDDEDVPPPIKSNRYLGYDVPSTKRGEPL